MLYALLLAVVALAGCAASSSGVIDSPVVADRTVTLPSGTTLKVAADWTVTAAPDGLVLEDPEKQLRIDFVEVAATPGMSAAISTAWARRRPGFDRKELAASDSPGREGWDLLRWTRYETSPGESRRVSAVGVRKGSLVVVALVDGLLSTAQRRSRTTKPSCRRSA